VSKSPGVAVRAGLSFASDRACAGVKEGRDEYAGVEAASLADRTSSYSASLLPFFRASLSNKRCNSALAPPVLRSTVYTWKNPSLRPLSASLIVISLDGGT
jgi:hypothetical protein